MATQSFIQPCNIFSFLFGVVRKNLNMSVKFVCGRLYKHNPYTVSINLLCSVVANVAWHKSWHFEQYNIMSKIDRRQRICKLGPLFSMLSPHLSLQCHVFPGPRILLLHWQYNVMWQVTLIRSTMGCWFTRKWSIWFFHAGVSDLQEFPSC